MLDTAPGLHASTAVPASEGARPRRFEWSAYVTFLILMGASIPWRAKSYYEGGFDPVVVAKATLSIVGLGMALSVGTRRPRLDIRAMPLLFAAAYLSCTVLGALAAGNLAASAVVAVRVSILVAAVLVLRQRFSGSSLVTAMIAAMGTFGAAGAATGIFSWDGRLSGGLPPLHPNELALFCGVVTLGCLAKVTVGEDRTRDLLIVGVAVVVMLATQSRTPVAALAVAAALLLLRTKLLRPGTFALAVAVAPIVVWVVFGTGLVEQFLARDQDSSQITTLSNRTIAWRAALGPQATPWAHWLGGGLSLKRIPVSGQYWNEQILDSSWISALVQGGLLGAVICAIWVVYTAVTVSARANPGRALQLALVVFVVLRSFLESGLFDATTAFVLFFTVTVAPPVPDSTAPESAGHIAATAVTEPL